MSTDLTDQIRLELRLREKYVRALHGATGPDFDGARAAAFIEDLPP
ncbi:hypothetical protein ACH4SP_12330 [Streptomyces sp. NPDC021093]